MLMTLIIELLTEVDIIVVAVRRGKTCCVHFGEIEVLIVN